MADSLEARLRQIEAEIAKGAKIGRLDVRPKTASQLEATIRRVFGRDPARLAAAMGELAEARTLAKTTWEKVQRSGGHYNPRGAAAKYLKKGGWFGTIPQRGDSGNLHVLLDFQFTLNHTEIDKNGKKCLTRFWITEGFLVYDAAAEPITHGHIEFPWFGLRGPKFQCYYPRSTEADWDMFFNSPSTGRTLNAWSQKSKYIKF